MLFFIEINMIVHERTLICVRTLMSAPFVFFASYVNI